MRCAMLQICLRSLEGSEYCNMALSTVREAGVNSEGDFQVIGLTGGMGAGKSVVARILNGLGHFVYDADAAAKRLYNSDAGLLEAVVGRFGQAVLDGSGMLNRGHLAQMVFSDANALAALNAMVHPVVARDFALWRNGHRRDGVPFVFREAAILFESGSYKDCDLVWGVQSPVALRLHRVRSRTGWSEDEIFQRMSRQWPEERVLERCDAVVLNDGSAPLVPQVLGLLSALNANLHSS